MRFLKANSKWFLLGIFIALNIFIIAESFMGGDASGAQSGRFADIAAQAVNFFKPGTIVPENIGEFNGFLRKFVGHYSLFALDGLVGFFTFKLLLSEKKWYLPLIANLSVGFGMAALTEIIQFLIPDRAGLITDVFIDFAGYLTSLLIAYLILLFIHIHKNRKIKNRANIE